MVKCFCGEAEESFMAASLHSDQSVPTFLEVNHLSRLKKLRNLHKRCLLTINLKIIKNTLWKVVFTRNPLLEIQWKYLVFKMYIYNLLPNSPVWVQVQEVYTKCIGPELLNQSDGYYGGILIIPFCLYLKLSVINSKNNHAVNHNQNSSFNKQNSLGELTY